MRGNPEQSSCIAALAAVAVIAAPAAGRAALAPAFTGKVVVDTQYVTQAAGATDIAFSGDGRALVTTKTGSIVVRHADGSQAVIAYPFGGTLDTASEKGVLGVVADPAVAQNRAFYFYVSNGPTTADKNRVYRAVLGTGDSLAVDATPIVAASRGLGPGLEGPGNHNGGGLFIANGKLFVSVGDTGSTGTPPQNKTGNCLNKGNGKLLRVNLDGTIPGDNPLVGLSSVTACDTPTGPWTVAAPDTRVYDWGLRNPWRFYVDARTGLAWVADVGEDTQEEVSIGGGGLDYGYPFVEGNQTWGPLDGRTCATATPSRACSAPAFTDDHSVGSAITGGAIVEGCGWTKALGGTQYLLGDSSSGWLKLLPVNAARTGFSSTTLVDFAFETSPVSFRMGPDQSLYAVLYGPGAVYRYTPADRTGTDCSSSVPAGSPRTAGLLWAALLIAGLALLGLKGRSRARRSGAPRA